MGRSLDEDSNYGWNQGEKEGGLDDWMIIGDDSLVSTTLRATHAHSAHEKSTSRSDI